MRPARQKIMQADTLIKNKIQDIFRKKERSKASRTFSLIYDRIGPVFPNDSAGAGPIPAGPASPFDSGRVCWYQGGCIHPTPPPEEPLPDVCALYDRHLSPACPRPAAAAVRGRPGQVPAPAAGAPGRRSRRPAGNAGLARRRAVFLGPRPVGGRGHLRPAPGTRPARPLAAGADRLFGDHRLRRPGGPDPDGAARRRGHRRPARPRPGGAALCPPHPPGFVPPRGNRFLAQLAVLPAAGRGADPARQRPGVGAVARPLPALRPVLPADVPDLQPHRHADRGRCGQDDPPGGGPGAPPPRPLPTGRRTPTARPRRPGVLLRQHRCGSAARPTPEKRQ